MFELVESLEKKRSLYYGKRKISILNIYKNFNLIDVVYENDSSIFTVDIVTVGLMPSEENGFIYK